MFPQVQQWKVIKTLQKPPTMDTRLFGKPLEFIAKFVCKQRNKR